jgi:allophanate hydrolase
MTQIGFDIAGLRAAYASEQTDPVEVARAALGRAAAQADANAWIALRPADELLAEAAALASRGPAALPLYGIPFAVKDNIDVAGLPTTAGCPEFAYMPAASASVVDLLRQAGALLVGKTNLDQFATGLVGVRSPYGACRNPFNPAYISGGSSSGSAVAVAGGAVSFALGTDTAGSGRVPAAFCNIVGWKGTCGFVSTKGVVPACRSLDCVSVFALNCEDAAAVAAVAGRFDAADPFSRVPPAAAGWAGLRVGVPREADLAFFGNPHTPALFGQAVSRMEWLGATLVEIDLRPFLDAARLLYEGPWLAERTAAAGAFLEAHPGAGEPVVRAIIEGGRRFSAVEAFEARYRLAELARLAEAVWRDVDTVLTPTAGTIHRIDAVQADPVRLNSQLGHYTNFMNLLDLAAVAVPSGMQPDGLPFGVTLFAPAGTDAALLRLGGRMHAAAGLPMGATGHALPAPAAKPEPMQDEMLELVVVGAHMSGMSLCAELLGLGAEKVETVVTAPFYRLYALEQLRPARPGLVRDPVAGAAIEGELWRIPPTALGRFLAGIAAPLGLGKLELRDGRVRTGFLCEAYAVAQAREITDFGGWRAWTEANAPVQVAQGQAVPLR